MKFKCNQNELFTAAQVSQKAVSTRSTLPILSGMLIGAKGNNLTFYSTNLEMSIKKSIKASINSEGEVVVPARLFNDMLRNLPDTDVECDLDLIKSQLNVKCSDSHFQIKTLNKDDFPTFPDPETKERFKLKWKPLSKVIAQVIRAASRDETRPILTGALLKIENSKLTLVATDSYRLAAGEIKVEGTSEGEIEVIIPALTLQELNKTIPEETEEVDLSLAENQIIFKNAGVTFISRLITGKFPDYEKLLPEGYETRAEVDRDGIIAATKRAALFAGESPIKLNITSNRFRISAESPETGEAQEEMEIKGEGKELEIAFNAQYLLDGLASVNGKEMLFEASNPLKPGLIKTAGKEGFKYIIMPVRLEK